MYLFRLLLKLKNIIIINIYIFFVKSVNGYKTRLNYRKIGFIYAVDKKMLYMMKILIKDGVEPNMWGDYAIKNAVKNNNVLMVKLLLKELIVNPSATENFAVRFAFKNGSKEILEMLIADDRVLSTLPSDDYQLYNKLVLSKKLLNF